jgi:predicted nucleotidyltransferase
LARSELVGSRLRRSGGIFVAQQKREALCLEPSDVDVLVEFAPGVKSFDRLLALSDLLEERFGRRVEVVTMEALSPFLGPRILAEAQDVLRAA